MVNTQKNKIIMNMVYYLVLSIYYCLFVNSSSLWKYNGLERGAARTLASRSHSSFDKDYFRTMSTYVGFFVFYYKIYNSSVLHVGGKISICPFLFCFSKRTHGNYFASHKHSSSKFIYVCLYSLLARKKDKKILWCGLISLILFF